MNLEDYREQEFGSVTRQGAYLNHAGVSPMPARVVQAVGESLAWAASSPSTYFLEGVLVQMEAARTRLARLMGVPADHLAFTQNTGHALSLVADALILEPGDNVVSAACEYPSVVYPWKAQAWRGIETRLAPAGPDGTIALEDLAAAMDGRTRVLTLSWVQFATGFRADLAALAALAHAHGALLVIDVIQGLGVLPLQAEALGIDIVATGVHKWLLAPGGTGGLYVAPHVLDRMRLVNMGALSVVNVEKFDPLDFSPKPTVRRYEEGTPNSLGLWGLGAALSLLEEIGEERIAAQVLALTAYGAQRLEEKGYRISSPREDDRRAGLLLFSHPHIPSETLKESLRAAGVTAAVRGGRTRLSPHFYNTREDMDRAIEALPD